MDADALHARGVTGANVTVGVVDTGFDVSHPDVAANVADTLAEGTTLPSRSAHGTAVAEAVAETAPDADLYLAAVGDGGDFRSATDWLVANDVDVVVMSMSWFPTPGDGTGSISRKAARTVADEGIVWVNSAGNSATDHWQGSFRDGDGDDLHDFAPGADANYLNDGQDVQAGETIHLVMEWDDWPATDDDYDLELYDANGNRVATGSGSGHRQPSETLTYEVPDGESDAYAFAVENAGATGDAQIEVYAMGGNGPLERVVEESSLLAPAANRSVVTVGAYNHRSKQVEYFSSRGPTDDGRRGVDVLGPDGTSSDVYGRFYGTSAAAPHVGGVAALLRGIDPGATPATIGGALRTTAADVDGDGPDPLEGHGRVNASAAAGVIEASTASPSPPPLDASGAVTGTVVDADGTGIPTAAAYVREVTFGDDDAYRVVVRPDADGDAGADRVDDPSDEFRVTLAVRTSGGDYRAVRNVTATAAELSNYSFPASDFPDLDASATAARGFELYSRTGGASDGTYALDPVPVVDGADAGPLEYRVRGVKLAAPFRGRSGTVEAQVGPNATAVADVTIPVQVAPGDLVASNLTAPASAAPGDRVAAAVTVRNAGGVAVERTVEFRFDLDGDGSLSESEALASQNVSLVPQGSERVSFDATLPGDLAEGTYAHGAFALDADGSVDDRTTGSLDVDDGSAGNVTVGLAPTDATLAVGETETLDVVVTGATGGVDGFELTVASSASGTVAVTDVAFLGDATATTRDAAFAADNSSVRAAEALSDLPAGDDVAVLEVTVAAAGAGAGAATLSVDATRVVDADGDPYAVTDGTGATVAVESRSGSTARTARVVLDGAPNGLRSADVTVATPGTNATVDSLEAHPNATLERTVAGGVGDGSVRRRALYDSVGPTDETVTLLAVTFSDPVAREDLSLTVSDVVAADSTAIDASRVSLRLGSGNPFPDGVPGVSDETPTDPDSDGRYEDVTGDGERTLADAFAFAFGPLQQADGLSDAQVTALDFDGDGSLDLDDAFALAFGG
jgi:subtilisin family serine protease